MRKDNENAVESQVDDEEEREEKDGDAAPEKQKPVSPLGVLRPRVARSANRAAC